MKISFHGAARTVTGSKHLVHLKQGKKILLDCGMFQGLGKDTLRLNHEWGFEPSEVDFVIISHAHIDHIGLLPKLVREGYAGRIWCTPPTADLMEILLIDSAHIQEADTTYISKQRGKEGRPGEEPLYTAADVAQVLPLLQTIPYDTPTRIDDDIELTYTDCGHILGSAAVHLKLREHGKETRLTFSGDVGRYRDMLLRSPDAFPQADVILMESTYGDRLHEATTVATDKLLELIESTCLRNRGKLIMPAFSIGRTQEILYMLNQLENERRLPKLKYFVDSPLSVKATGIIRRHPECFNATVQKLLQRDKDVFGFEGLHFIRDVQESVALNTSGEPCVIISASGMAEAGRVKHHIAHNVEDGRNTILMTGYCEPHSLGARLQEGGDHITIFGREYKLRARVEAIRSLSAHGDYEDLFQWLACQDIRTVRKMILVHGEYEAQIALKGRLIKKGFDDVEIPGLHDTIGLGH